MGLPGATDFAAWGENSKGQLAGQSRISYDYLTATVWTNGVPIDIGNSTNESNETIAFDINNFDQVVGSGASGGSGALLWGNGNVYNLNSLVNNLGDWHLQSAFGINDQGRIIGYMNSTDGEDYYVESIFLLTPYVNVSAVPAPAAIWLFASGLGVLGFAKRRKR